MYDAIRAKGGVGKGGMFYSIYFILLVVFGNCILLLLANYFIEIYRINFPIVWPVISKYAYS